MSIFRKRSGFSLIELLVVIAIIAILAAVLFPIFVRAKFQGKSAACLSNCKQLGHGLMLYAQDWSDAFPVTNFHDGFNRGVKSRFGYDLEFWGDLIFPYVKNYNVYYCPARVKKTPTGKVDIGQGEGNDFGWGLQTKPVGYAISCYIDAGFYGDGGKAMKQVAIREASKKILLGEMSGGITQCAIWHMYCIAKCAEAHGGRGNWVFCDGHAASLKVSQTIVPRFMWNLSDEYPFTLYPWSPPKLAANVKEAQDYALSVLGAEAP